MIYIIGEVACEHLGSVERAKQLIDIVVASGADAVKFQYFYRKEIGEKIWKAVKKYALTDDELIKLKEYAEKQNIEWLCSAFGIKSLQVLSDIGLKTVKIPSPYLSDLQMLDVAGELFPNIILSTGLHNLTEIKRATEYLNRWLEPKSVAVLHCTSVYPCPMNEINLKAMLTLKQEVNKAGKFGISDHSVDTVVPIAAVALGAEIIEKHITLSRDNGGPDARCSLETLEFINMVRAVRNTELALGNGLKEISPLEEQLLWRKKQ